ncbi:MAG: hypothetical protein HY904_03430 [Deltaproteobacteria bacterium]|nr:hypothetical protein [Deltaproteobacteria bacterium]
MRRAPVVLFTVLGCAGCPRPGGMDAGTPPTDSGHPAPDAAVHDAGPDAGGADAAQPPADAGLPDAGPADAAVAPDAAVVDAAQPPADAGATDAASAVDAAWVVPACVEAVMGGSAATTARVDDGARQATATWVSGTGCARTWTLTSNATRRDGLPASPRIITEQPGWPSLQTGNPMLDALHALALQEVRDNSVASIHDGSFSNGAPLSCPAGGCFETGRLWTYVWTRDVAYSVHLGLGALDPQRAANSLLFKLSARRDGTLPEIVQDTGTGGSWPVSTDRVAWALGAGALVHHLEPAARAAFLDAAIPALQNTMERDRRVVFDALAGLYPGETSFLDWREQTYPAWTATDPARIAQGRALSTNTLHLAALRTLSTWLAERGDATAAARYQGWADALRTSMRAALVVPDWGVFGAYVPGPLDPAPVARRDLLADALAILFDVADAPQALDMLSTYPHLERGAPVTWPQQKETPIYHNRAAWPFVTAYAMRAARRAGHDAVVAHGVRTLVRAAALNLSNMENFEIVSGDAYLDDGAYSGPVVNSQRQLWSVAGFVSMVHQVLFGLEHDAAGLMVRPFLPRAVRQAWFPGASSIALDGYHWRGKEVHVVLDLPAGDAATDGAYGVGTVALNGVALAGPVSWDALGARNLVRVTLTSTGTPARTLTQITDTTDYRRIFGPRTPVITSASVEAGGVRLALDAAGEAPTDVTWNILRDGTRIAANLPGSTTSYLDTGAPTDRAPCYTAELVFLVGGNRSQHAAAVCAWGAATDRIQSFPAGALQNVGGTYVLNHGRHHFENWGDPGHSLTLPSFTPVRSGRHLLQVVAGNGAGPVSTGITCSVKRLRVQRLPDGTDMATGHLAMPQLGTWDAWQDATFVAADLVAGTAYRVVIDNGADALNMSSFAHFGAYTAGTGGSATFNRVNIAELKVLEVHP